MANFFWGFVAFPVLFIICLACYMACLYWQMRSVGDKCVKAQAKAYHLANDAKSLHTIDMLMVQSGERTIIMQKAGIAKWPAFIAEMDLFARLQQRNNEIVRSS